MKLDDSSLVSLYESFPLLRDCLVQHSISSSEFYALATLRNTEMNDKVSKILSWISESLVLVPPQEIELKLPSDIEKLDL